MNCLKNTFTNYQSPRDMYKQLREAEGVRNENQVYLIKMGLDGTRTKNINTKPNPQQITNFVSTIKCWK